MKRGDERTTIPIIRRFIRSFELLSGCPLLVPFWVTNRKAVILEDVLRWQDVLDMKREPLGGLLDLLTTHPEFRDLYRYRLRTGNFIGRAVAAGVYLPYRTQVGLFLHCPDIGPGLFLQHAFSTIVVARRIGANCWINQQVTIGFKANSDCPILGDDVIVGAGAKVLGSVRIGNQVVIGANAVVLSDVPDHCVVAGVPARIVRRNGIRIDEGL